MLFITLIKREFIEHKSLWLAPLITMIIIGILQPLVMVNNGHLTLTLNDQATSITSMSPELLKSIGFENIPWLHYSAMFVITTITVIIYALNALFLDKQDRTILFWKSIMISDTLIVLSKFTTALLTLLTACIYSFALTLCWKYTLLLTNHITPHPMYLVLSTKMLALTDYYPIIMHNIIVTIMYPFTILFALFCSSYAKRSPFWYALFALILIQILTKSMLNINLPGFIESIVNIPILSKPDAALKALISELHKPSLWIIYAISATLFCLSVISRKWRIQT